MSAELPFYEHPMLRMLHFASEAFSGLERLLTVFYNRDLNKLQAYSLMVSAEEKTKAEPLDIHEFYGYFFSRRREMKPYEWLVNEDLPFETRRSNYVPVIFDEFQRNILVLRLSNPDDSNRDLLYLFFDPRKIIKGINAGLQEFDTARKDLLAEMAYRVSLALLQSFQNDSQHFQRFVANTRFLAQKIQQERSRLESMQKNIGQSLINLALDIIGEYALQKGIKIHLSSEAELLIRNYSGDITLLRKAIVEACIFAHTLNEGPSKELTIYDWHLRFDGHEIKGKAQGKADERKHDGKIQRTLALLNRLEQATRQVIEKNLPVTGKNLGLFCDKPISAPAISDAIKKHHDRIQELLRQFPENWPLLREHFTPVNQILKPKKNFGQQKAAG
ncbi:MAG: hypothetical protein PWR20_2259 [Bacteroidales bacterium]|jgi:hypothetical protein|nr:hypothetical protein [Bacteroidales bacterium]MDN5329718.1 hypothetical protein [Bacteroidales bacterium]